MMKRIFVVGALVGGLAAPVDAQSLRGMSIEVVPAVPSNCVVGEAFIVASTGDLSICRGPATTTQVGWSGQGGGSGPSVVDDQTFAVGVQEVSPIAGVFQPTADLVDPNDSGSIRMSNDRSLFIQVRDGAGNQRSLNIAADGSIAVTLAAVPSHPVTNAGTFAVQVSAALPAGTNNIGDVDVVSLPTLANVTTVGTVTTLATLTGGGVASGAADSGNPVKIGGRYNATPPTLTNGQRGDLQLTPSGGVKTTIYTAAGVELTPSVDVVEDAPETAGGSGPMMLSVRRDASVSSAGSAGDNATVNTDANGLLWTRFLDPCTGPKLYAPFSITTATTTQLIAASAGNRAYICAINLLNAGAQNIALIEDDTAACTSPTSGMAGGVSAASGWNLSAGSGLAQGGGLGAIAATAAANRFVCLISSAATQTSGTVVYALAP